MSTYALLRIILLPILMFSLITCKKNNNPIEVENKNPIVVSDSWSLLPNSPGNPVWAMFITSDGVLYAGIKGGLVRSFDNGLNWEQVYSSGTPSSIYVSPYDSMIILSLTGTFNTTIVYSNDNGLTWKQPIEQPKNSSITNYLSLPSGEILAGGHVHDESSGGIFISEDKCVTWNRVPDFVNGPSVLSFALNSENNIYAAIGFGFPSYTTAIYCSKDKGQSWLQIMKPDSLIINNMVITRNDALIISTDKNIFLSESNTDNWKPLLPAIYDVFIESLVLDSNENIFVSFFDREDAIYKVFLFSELNQNWYSIEGSNLPTSGNYFRTFVGKDRHIILYTFDNGIYITKQSIDSILKLK